MVDSDPSTAPEAPTVAASAHQCLESFQSCLVRADAVHPRELSMVEDQLARFSSWAASIGVFAPGAASMDHRLRYTPEVQNIVTGLLESLNYRVRIYSNSLATVADSSTLDPERISDKRLEGCFLEIAAEITRLNKISNTIRRASKEAQRLKASDFQIKDDEGKNVEPLLVRIFEHYIADRFPHVSDAIRSRLVRSMLLRRKQIMYRRYRAGNTYSQFKGIISPVSIKLPGAQPTAAPLATEKPNQQDKKRPASRLAASQVKSATTLVAENYKMTSTTPSKVSVSRTIASGKHQALVYPSAPGFAAKRAYEQFKSQQTEEAAKTNTESGLQDLLASHLQKIGEITCPFCLHALPAAEVFDTRKWQNHVRGDLEPYVCLFEDCDQPDILYTHSEEWLGHLHQHKKFWYCSLRCEIGSFSELEEYMGHMRQVHNTKLNDRQLRTIANRNSRRTGALFSSCPLCGQEESEVESRLEDHLAGHLRSLALKSLPSYQDGIPDDAASVHTSINGSQPRSRSTIKDVFEEAVRPFQSGADSAVEERSEPPQLGSVELNFMGEAYKLLDLGDESISSANAFDSMVFKAGAANLEKDPILQSILEQQSRRATVSHDPPDNIEDPQGYHSATDEPKSSTTQPSKQDEADSGAIRTINAKEAGSGVAGSAENNQALDEASSSPFYDGVYSKKREAHGLHGHGNTPFLCTYDGCERSQPGLGFPRQWNLRDHMKRVHNDTGDVAAADPTPAPEPVKGRKRKTETNELTASERKAPPKPAPLPSSRNIATIQPVDQRDPPTDVDGNATHFPVSTKHPRVVSPLQDKHDDKPLRGILKQPSTKFPEEANPIREGVAPHEDKRLQEVPPGARWTQISRSLVSPEALTIGKERFEERDGFVIVLRVLSEEEIGTYAATTRVLRGQQMIRTGNMSISDMESYGSSRTIGRATKSQEEPITRYSYLGGDQAPLRASEEITFDNFRFKDIDPPATEHERSSQNKGKDPSYHPASDHWKSRLDFSSPSATRSLAGQKRNLSGYSPEELGDASASAPNIIRRASHKARDNEDRRKMPPPPGIPQRPMSAAPQQTGAFRRPVSPPPRHRTAPKASYTQSANDMYRYNHQEYESSIQRRLSEHGGMEYREHYYMEPKTRDALYYQAAGSSGPTIPLTAEMLRKASRRNPRSQSNRDDSESRPGRTTGSAHSSSDSGAEDYATIKVGGATLKVPRGSEITVGQGQTQIRSADTVYQTEDGTLSTQRRTRSTRDKSSTKYPNEAGGSSAQQQTSRFTDRRGKNPHGVRHETARPRGQQQSRSPLVQDEEDIGFDDMHPTELLTNARTTRSLSSETSSMTKDQLYATDDSEGLETRLREETAMPSYHQATQPAQLAATAEPAETDDVGQSSAKDEETHQTGSRTAVPRAKPRVRMLFTVITSRVPDYIEYAWYPKGLFSDYTLDQLKQEIGLVQSDQSKGIIFRLTGPGVDSITLLRPGSDNQFEIFKKDVKIGILNGLKLTGKSVSDSEATFRLVIEDWSEEDQLFSRDEDEHNNVHEGQEPLRPGDWNETTSNIRESEPEQNPPGIDSFLSPHLLGDYTDLDPSIKNLVLPGVDRQHMANEIITGYQVEYSGRFQPGQIFKIYWPEPQGAMRDASESSSSGGATVVDRYGNPIYVGIRRFIIISSDVGHCLCLPIVTYGRRGTNKAGVRPEKHGVVYERGTAYVKLDEERRLGYRPVRVEMTAEGEVLPDEARINYSKVVTVELNLKVFFVGHVYEDDWAIVEDAFNDCWNKKTRRNKGK